jgi:hypothetical protein
MMEGLQLPLIVRGRIEPDCPLEFQLRRGGETFATADVGQHLDELVLDSPSQLADLYALKLDDIVDFLDELGRTLKADRNGRVEQAFRASSITSGLSDGVLRQAYARMCDVFRRDFLLQMAERSVGVDYLDGWVSTPVSNGSVVAIRAFGARAVHIVAGNSPTVSTLSIARNALTRSDGIIKAPSNDPLTAAAIVRAMIDIDPEHPVTRHVSVAYWKGGDAAIEERIYQPRYIEKIVAWGGLASVSHIAKYIQPGIDLITLDPKLSSTIIGREAFAGERAMREAAKRAALDVGALNQEGCVNARVIYVETGCDEHGLGLANRFGDMLRGEILALPPHVSGPAKRFDPILAEEMSALRFTDDYRLFGGGVEGGVIVSQGDRPVEFARLLAHRVANVVPVDDIETPIRAVTAYTQTIGVYPESLKTQIRDRLAFHGGQRLVSLGCAASTGLSALTGLQDGIEPMRRMCKWIVDESTAADALTLYGEPLAVNA